LLDQSRRTGEHSAVRRAGRARLKTYMHTVPLAMNLELRNKVVILLVRTSKESYNPRASLKSNQTEIFGLEESASISVAPVASVLSEDRKTGEQKETRVSTLKEVEQKGSEKKHCAQ
jgi:hypothetical protein